MQILAVRTHAETVYHKALSMYIQLGMDKLTAEHLAGAARQECYQRFLEVE